MEKTYNGVKQPKRLEYQLRHFKDGIEKENWLQVGHLVTEDFTQIVS